MNIWRSPLPRKVTANWSTNKTIILSLDLGKVVEGYCYFLLEDSDYESYLA